MNFHNKNNFGFGLILLNNLFQSMESLDAITGVSSTQISYIMDKTYYRVNILIYSLNQ